MGKDGGAKYLLVVDSSREVRLEKTVSTSGRLGGRLHFWLNLNLNLNGIELAAAKDRQMVMKKDKQVCES